MSDFVKIDRSERPVRTRGAGILSEMNLALLAGETLFFADPLKGVSVAGGSRPSLKARGYRVVTAALVRDGVRGMAVWAEPLEPKAEAPR